MPPLVREGHDLRLNARAVARADALYDAGVDGRAVEVPADDLMRPLIRVGEPAARAVHRRGLGLEREGLGLGVALLDLHFGKVHAPGVYPGRRACLEAAERETQLAQPLRQRPRGGQPVRTGVSDDLAHDGAALEEGTRRHDGRAAAPDCARVRRHGDDSPILDAYVHDLCLDEPEPLLPLERALHDLLVLPPVRLRPERVYRRAFAEVQHPVLDAGGVRGPGHLSAEGVQLPDEVALARAAYGRVAGHVPHRVEVYGKADRLHAEARRGQRGLYPGVARAYNDYIAFSRVISSHNL